MKTHTLTTLKPKACRTAAPSWNKQISLGIEVVFGGQAAQDKSKL